MKLRKFLGTLLAAMALAPSLALAYTVSNTNDSGAGSLRQAITDANAACISFPAPTISFAIPGAGPHTIQPLSVLPAMTCSGTTIDGTSQAGYSANTDSGGSDNANLQLILDGSSPTCGGCDGLQFAANGTVRGLAIRSFERHGVWVLGGFVQVYGNYIGTDPGGMNAFGNGGYGVRFDGGGGLVGSFALDGRNVISNNGQGGVFFGSGASGDVTKNLIGGKRDGSGPNGNGGPGILYESGFGDSDVTDSYVRYNSGAGIAITGAGDVSVNGGGIHSNGGIGIDLKNDGVTGNDADDSDSGPNALLNHPTITAHFIPPPLVDASPTVTARIQTTPNRQVSFRFYANATYSPDKREGGMFVASVTGMTNATTGFLEMSTGVPVGANNLSVTATMDTCFEGCDFTSEFSPMFVPPAPPLVGTGFEPTSIFTGGTSNFVVSLKNTNTTTVNNIGYSVTAPAGLTTVSSVPRADCPAGFSVGPPGATINVSGMNLAPGQTCTIDFGMSAASAGTYTYPANSITVYSDEAADTTNPASATLTVTDPAPAVLLSPTSLTFPTQTVGTTSKAQLVTLKNSGTATLLIANITVDGDYGYSGCGFPSSLAPGASCTFAVTFSPKVPGKHPGSIRIDTNAAGSPHVISLFGEATSATFPSIAASPSTLAFGAVTTGSSVRQNVTITNTGSAPLNIFGVDTTGSAFSPTSRCPATLDPGFSCEIAVSFSPSTDGTHTGELRIASNAEPSPFIVPLNGTAMPLPPASLSAPGSIDFGQQVVGTIGRRTLELRNTGSQALLIQQVRVGAPFAVEGTCTSIAPGGTCSLTVLFTPTAFVIFGGNLEIVSNSAGGMVRIELFGEGVRVPEAALEVSVAGLGFGNQGLGTQSDPRTVTLHSVGGLPVELRNFVLATPDFVVDTTGCPAVLAVDARCDVSVAFRPLVAGPRTGRLTILGNMPGQPPFVSLTGTGCRFFSMGAGRNPARLCSP